MRPTRREIDKRLKEARQALDNGQCMFANLAKLHEERSEFNITHISEIFPLILSVLSEIEIEHYIGTYPPMKSYESTIAGCELYAFKWDSEILQKTMYLKFALQNGVFFFVSLHESRKK